MGKWSQTSVPSLAGKEMGEKITGREGAAAYDGNLLRCSLLVCSEEGTREQWAFMEIFIQEGRAQTLREQRYSLLLIYHFPFVTRRNSPGR